MTLPTYRLRKVRPWYPSSRHVQPHKIIRCAQAACGINEFEFFSRSKQRDIVTSRQIAQYLLKQYTHMSLTQIGTLTGKDHATVMWSCKEITGDLDMLVKRNITTPRIELLNKVQAML